jgi:hypothetical protein
MIGPVSTPASTRKTVQRGMGVDETPAEALQERRPGQLHEPGGHDQVRLVLGHLVGHRAVPRRTVWKVADPEHEGRYADAFGPSQRLDPVAIRTDGHDRGAVRRVGAGVEESLQVGATARDEHDQPGGHGGLTSRVEDGGSGAGKESGDLLNQG